MDLIPWKPFREIESLRSEMDRIVIEVDLSGMDGKDFDISLVNDRLTIIRFENCLGGALG